MKETICLLALNMTSTAAVFGAGYVAAQDGKGWGWFLLVAVLLHSSPKLKDKDKDDDGDEDGQEYENKKP